MKILKNLATATLLLASIPAMAETIRVGATSGIMSEILEVVKPVAAARGLDIRIVEFNDYVMPNRALAEGDIQANAFQHKPFLDMQAADRKLAIESVAPTVSFPMGFYSRKVKSFDDLKDGAQVAIQNDPSNGGRSLLLLRDKGYITLREGVGLKPTVADVVTNRKRLRFVEIEAAMAPRVLDDVDVAAINTNFLANAGLQPTDAILREEPKGPYANVIAVRTADRDKPWVKTLVESYQSDEVKAFVAKAYKGNAHPAW